MQKKVEGILVYNEEFFKDNLYNLISNINKADGYLYYK